MSCLTFELVVHVFLHLPFHLPLLLLQLHVRVVVALGGGANIAGIIVAAAAASSLPTLLAAVVVAVAALLRGAAASAPTGTVCSKKGLYLVFCIIRHSITFVFSTARSHILKNHFLKKIQNLNLNIIFFEMN